MTQSNPDKLKMEFVDCTFDQRCPTCGRMGWVSVDTPPNEPGYYLVQRKRNPLATTRWFDGKFWASSDTVIFWQPLPEPAK